MFPINNQAIGLYNYSHNDDQAKKLEKEVEEKISLPNLSPENVDKTIEKIRRLPLEICSKNNVMLNSAVSNFLHSIDRNSKRLTDIFYKLSEELLLAGCDPNLKPIQGSPILKNVLHELNCSQIVSVLFCKDKKVQKRVDNKYKLTKLLLSFGAEKNYCYYYDNQENKILVNNDLDPELIKHYKKAKKDSSLNTNHLLKLGRICFVPILPSQLASAFLHGWSDKNSVISTLPKEIVAHILTTGKMKTCFHELAREKKKKFFERLIFDLAKQVEQ